jgi:glycerol-3-phosphate cytidylyltransferase
MSKQIGYTTGVFDLFHIGHLNILQRAREVCDELIVGVTSDELARDRKGSRPAVPFSERSEIVRALRCVDRVVEQAEINELGDWERLKFDMIFKGDDWKDTPRWRQLIDDFRVRGVEVMFFPYTKTTSSSLIREFLSRHSGRSEPCS